MALVIHGSPEEAQAQKAARARLAKSKAAPAARKTAPPAAPKGSPGAAMSRGLSGLAATQKKLAEIAKKQGKKGKK